MFCGHTSLCASRVGRHGWLRFQAAPSSRAFYVRAVKKMWTQVIVLCVSALGQIVAAGVLTLTQAGKRTPGILYAALVRCNESNAPSFIRCVRAPRACHIFVSWVHGIASSRKFPSPPLLEEADIWSQIKNAVGFAYDKVRIEEGMPGLGGWWYYSGFHLNVFFLCEAIPETIGLLPTRCYVIISCGQECH